MLQGGLTYKIIMSFCPPVVGCFLKERLTKKRVGSRALQTSPQIRLLVLFITLRNKYLHCKYLTTII